MFETKTYSKFSCAFCVLREFNRRGQRNFYRSRALDHAQDHAPAPYFSSSGSTAAHNYSQYVCLWLCVWVCLWQSITPISIRFSSYIKTRGNYTSFFSFAVPSIVTQCSCRNVHCDSNWTIVNFSIGYNWTERWNLLHFRAFVRLWRAQFDKIFNLIWRCLVAEKKILWRTKYCRRSGVPVALALPDC